MDGLWLRGYMVSPPSIMSGLTSTSKGQTLESRCFTGIFPRSCVQVREVLGDEENDGNDSANGEALTNGHGHKRSRSGSLDGSSPVSSPGMLQVKDTKPLRLSELAGQANAKGTRNSTLGLFDNPLTKSPHLSFDKPRKLDHLKPIAPQPMLKIGDESPTSLAEPLVDEISSCLREWHAQNMNQLMMSRQYTLVDKMDSLVKSLFMARRQLLHGVLTNYELRAMREQTVWDLVRGNKLFSGEVIVRDPAQKGRVLTGDDSAVEIAKLQSMMSLLDEKPQPSVHENLSHHHLLVDVKSFVGSSNESTTLVLYLASRSPGQAVVPLSDNYIVDVPASGALTSIAKPGQMRTLFIDLASSDIGEVPNPDNDLYLVVKVRTSQQITAANPKLRTASREGTPTRNPEKQQTPTPTLKGRRSMMWGSQRMGKNSPISSKLNSLSEHGENESTTGGRPPSTAGSRGTESNKVNAGTVTRIVSRTVGIGALKINSVMSSNEEVEQLMTIWAPSTGFGPDTQEVEGFDDVIKNLMGSTTGKFDKSRRAERLQLSLKSFDSPDADELIKATPTLLSSVVKTPKMGFSGAPTKPRSDIYITITEAWLPRQALLSRPVGSATPMSSSIAGTNLQVTLEVRRANGDRIEDCIFVSSNSEGTGSWESTVAGRGEAWSQTLRLVVPALEVPTCHIVTVVADAPSNPFAICYMPLWDQGAFMRDGYHSLLLYRYDDTTSSSRPGTQGRGGYLSLNWNSRGKDDVSKDEAVTGPIATLRLQTYLCSTRFSQDKVLLGLLRWKEQPPGEVQDLLKRLVFVPEIEIVKLLNDVFDSIFGILVEHTGNDDYEDLIFSALVTVLGIVHDRRFNLGPLVDQYAENCFNYPFATPSLVRSFTRLLANPADPETSRKLRATFKVVNHILKFITHARGQQKEKEVGIGITSTSPGFARHLRTIFKSLDALMRNTAPILVGSQTLAVQHFHTWLPELTPLLSTEEILHIAIDFVDSCAAVKGKLVLYKLVLIINYIKLELFSQPEQRSALCANTVRWLAPHWGKTNEVTEQWREQVRLCCSILSTQIDNLGPEIPDYIPKILDSYLAIKASPRTPKTRLSLLFPTTYPFPSKPLSVEADFDEVLVELSSILSSVSTLPAGMQLELEEDEMAALIENLLRVYSSILECEAFPSDWLSVHIYHHTSAMRILEYISTILLDSFLPVPDEAENFNTDLWKAFFITLLRLMGSKTLALETFSEQKRRAVWKISGDVRQDGAQLMRKTWEAIGWETSLEERQAYGLTRMGGYQVQYVPALVGPVTELCLSIHASLRNVSVEVLRTMIVSEWTLSEDLSIIQAEMIDCLDRWFKSRVIPSSGFEKPFIGELQSLFEPLAHADDQLYGAVKDVIVTIDEFLDLLVAVHTHDASGEATHMIHRLRLMDFLKDMQKEEIYIRYVHQLAQVQVNAGNTTEAGLALRLHADIYDWDPMTVVEALCDPQFPAQTQFERKEKIFFEMIKHFEDGEAWSSALSAYQELQAQYQENVYDFPKLARTQRAIATIYETIGKAEKVVPKYFRVTYSGMGFPPTLRDKEFVYEGNPTERTSAFTDRMQEQHPNAHVVVSGGVDDVEGQFLQISALSPHRDFKNHVYQRSRVPQIVRDYLLCEHPQMFAVTSKRDTSGPASEHTAEKTIYQTAETFPTILRRSEIISVDTIHMNALQTGVERVIRKTVEMIAVEKRLLQGEDEMAPLLIEALNLAVNPMSNASMSRYRDLLPAPIYDDDESSEEMELSPLQNALKMALIDHAIMIKRCLANFAKSDSQAKALMVKEDLVQSRFLFLSQPHIIPSSSTNNLPSDFEFTYAPEIAMLTIPQQTRESTPTPTWNVGSPVSSDRRSSRKFPVSNTFGSFATTDTYSTVDTPTNQGARARGRLSFMKRNNSTAQEVQEAVLAPITNGKSTGSPLKVIKDVTPQKAMTSNDTTRGRGDSTAARSRSDSKENRNSYFLNNRTDKEEEVGWVTSSDISQSRNVNGNNTTVVKQKESPSARRSSSSQRPESVENTPATGGGTVGRGVSSVKKRFSMLKLGKKNSKGTLLMGGLREED